MAKFFVLIIGIMSAVSAFDITQPIENLNREFLILRDKNASLSYSQILALNDTHFHSFDEKEKKVKLTRDAIWLRLYLENPTSTIAVRYIRQNDFLINSLELFAKGHYYKAGTFYPKQDSFTHPTAKITIPPHTKLQIDMRLYSQTTPIKIEFFFDKEEATVAFEMNYKLIEGLLFGFLIALVIYNGVIFLFIRDKSYLYYVSYIFALMIHHSRYGGIGQLYLYPDSPMLVTYMGAPSMALLLIMAILFTRSFLGLAQYKKLNRILNVTVWIVLLVGTIMLYRPFYSIELMMYLVIAVGSLMLFSAVYAMRLGRLEAKIYFLGWIPLLFVLITMAIKKVYGTIGIETITYVAESSIAFEAIIFSIALAIRIKRLQEEKLHVSNEFISYQSKVQQKLEIEVKNRTSDLQQSLNERDVLLREVNHRVKNNMQIIISMLRLQADKHDENVKKIVTIAENRIRSMLSIHELLYKSEDLSKVDASLYITNLIEAISSSFSFDDKQINAEITDVELPMDILVQSGFIINELVTNAIKYAYNANGVEIYVRLNVQDEKILLEVDDNGDKAQDLVHEGLGTVFVRTIVEEQLGGVLKIVYDKGRVVSASFPK